MEKTIPIIYACNDNVVNLCSVSIASIIENASDKNKYNIYVFHTRLAKEDATDEQIQSICKKVGIHEFIMNLPEKYDTNIGEGEFLLSGGQRQRIAIARTLLKNTKIILCDEITSSLDHNLEENIIELLGELKKQHTIIFITHRPDLIKKGDKKYLLENGKIREY